MMVPPCLMPEKNPVAFVVVGSAPIHESDPVNELAEIRIVRALARGRSNSNGGSVIRTTSRRAGFWIAGKKTECLNRCGCRDR
jgi:hypothetical protein